MSLHTVLNGSILEGNEKKASAMAWIRKGLALYFHLERAVNRMTVNSRLAWRAARRRNLFNERDTAVSASWDHYWIARDA